MPVSAFSSGQVRNHGAMLARWSTTRERLSTDERRMSMGEVAEMDGTGLHDRDNWPLNPSRPGSLSPQLTAHKRTVSRDSNAMPDDQEMLPQVEGIHFDDDDENSSHGEAPGQDEAESIGAAGLTTSEEESSRSASADASSRFSAEEERETHAMERNSVHSSSVTSPNGVSPMQDDNSIQVSDMGSEGAQQQVQTSGGRDIGQRTDNERNVSPQSEAQQENDNSTSTWSSTESNTNGTVHPQQRSHMSSPSTHADQHSLQQESIDVPTPLQQTPPVGTGEFARTNGTSTPVMHRTAHDRVSSIAKGTPPQRRTSRRGSNPNTAFIPSNKDRVRYSWQSLQDDEPNRPRIHIIKLVSNTATASAGFPGGEALGFSISPSGRRIAAYNSARLFVLQTAALPVGISQDFAIRRRPLAVEIVDDGTTLAVLADEHTINVYSLQGPNVKRTRTLKLDYPTNCIALASTGGLLAAAYEGGIEIFSLDANALPTDRRAVRSVRMDRLAFSGDGSTLLGTTTRINTSSTVVVSVPLFSGSEDGVPTHSELKEAWCSELLHPENIRNSSHATFMREDRNSCNERLFAWNGLADTFGILNTGDMQYGNVDFPVVISPPLSTCGGLGAAIHSCPAIDEHGDTVAIIVNDRTIRLYIVPHKAEDNETTVEAHSIDHELDEGYGCPFGEVRWVYSQASLPAPLSNQTQVQGRLIVTSPGGIVEPDLPDEAVPEVEGGRIILFDFDPQFAGQPGQTFSLTLGKSPPQRLEEEEVDAAREVALVRRRTVNQSKSGSLSQKPITLGRAATMFGSRPGRSESPSGPTNSPPPAFANRRSVLSVHSLPGSEAARSLPDLVEQNEGADIAVEEPFSNTAPRAQASLQRAASNLQRHRFQALEERQQERVSVDSNGTFLPLPEYTEEPNAPLPSKYRAMAGLDAPKQYPVRPSVVTNLSSNHSASSVSEPMTAPVARTTTWESEPTFSPVSRVGTMESNNQQVFSPVSRSGTISFDHPVAQSTGPTPSRSAAWQQAIMADAASTAPRESFIHQHVAQQTSPAPLPRSLQRAYSNAIGHGPPPSLIGDWENVSPVGAPAARPFSPGSSRNAPSTPSSSAQEESWDTISPVNSRTLSSHQRYSASHLSPLGQTPNRTPSNASSFGTSASAMRAAPYSNRRLPPHMQAFRNQASLFPPSQPVDHVPLPLHRQQKAGNVAHPVTAWHPPAPSLGVSSPTAPPGTASSVGRGHMRSHSRQSSLSKKTAFPSTEKAKKMGFFKRRQKQQVFGPDGASIVTGDGRSEYTFKTQSNATWMSRSDKCAVM